MNGPPRNASVGAGREGRGDPRAHREPPRWARRLRRVLFWLIGLLYAASIPWYRGDAPPARIFGLPDWVAVAILCYAAAAILNAAAWLLAEIPDSGAADEAREP
jgi:hypothetical protein